MPFLSHKRGLAKSSILKKSAFAYLRLFSIRPPSRWAVIRKEDTMTRKNTFIGRIGLISILTMLGASTTMAQAGDRHRGGYGDRHRHSSTCGCTDYASAGRITIDGHSTSISSGRGMHAQIAGAFRRAGYRAWIQDGCVRVDYGHCKPSVRWYADDYSIKIRWGWDELRLSTRRAYQPRYQPRRVVYPVRRSVRYGIYG